MAPRKNFCFDALVHFLVTGHMCIQEREKNENLQAFHPSSIILLNVSTTKRQILAGWKQQTSGGFSTTNNR